MKTPLLLATLTTMLCACQPGPPPVVEAHFAPDESCTADEDSTPGTLSVSGTATLEVTPDIADVRMDLTSQARTPSAAAATLRKRESKMRASLDEQGVGTDQVTVSTLSLQPKTRWDANRELNVLVGYQASMAVTVSTSDFDRIPAVIEASAEAGVTSVATQFRSTKLPELKAKVRDMALRAAKSKTDQFTGALDMTIAGVRQVAEAPTGAGWTAYGRTLDNFVANNAEFAVVPSTLTEIRPETHPLTLTVNITYELA